MIPHLLSVDDLREDFLINLQDEAIKNKGKIKKVGITSSGTKAIKGTIAADLNIFPYGTIFYIPDYGWGKVEDDGSAIKGYHIDLFFKSHQEALNWGRKNKDVHVWFPN